jgi:hypothetical protein
MIRVEITPRDACVLKRRAIEIVGTLELATGQADFFPLVDMKQATAGPLNDQRRSHGGPGASTG